MTNIGEKNKIFYIYYLRRLDKSDPFDFDLAQPFYIGKGCNGRLGDHRKEAIGLLHRPGIKTIKVRIIHKLWRQGLDFTEEVICNNLTQEEAFELEMEAIKMHGRIDLGTGYLANLTGGGEGAAGAVCSEETKEILRKKRLLQKDPKKGKKLSPESIRRIVESRKGFRHTEETKQKISEKKKGSTFIHTQEAKDNISKAKKGVKQSPEHVEANRQAHIGYKHKEDTKKLLSDLWKGKPKTKEHCENISKGKQGKPNLKLRGQSASPERKERVRQTITKWWAERKLKKESNIDRPQA